MTQPLAWPWSKPNPPPREYDYCAKHGDLRRRLSLSGWHMELGGMPLHRPICPYCYGEWLETMFPVERRKE